MSPSLDRLLTKKWVERIHRYSKLYDGKTRCSLVKANQNITQIAAQLRPNKFTISLELGRNEGLRCYRPKQACELALDRFRVEQANALAKRESDGLMGLQ